MMRKLLAANNGTAGSAFNEAGTPALDLNFAYNKTLPGTVTFTRASIGTYYGSDGLLKTANNDVARFDHDPVTRESKGLLIEESRQNAMLQSQDTEITREVAVSGGSGTFTDGETVTATGGGTGVYVLASSSSSIFALKGTSGTFTGTLTGGTSGATRTLGVVFTPWDVLNVSISANNTTSPDGTSNADKVVENTASGSHTYYQSRVATTSTAYTVSLFAKAAGRTALRLQIYTDGATDVARADYDLSAGTASAVTLTGSMTSGSASITSVGNGWYRCTITATTKGAGVTVLTSQIALLSGGTTSYLGDGSSGIYAWGHQMEAGAFPTSYIPTTTTALTRSADVASMTGANFSSWYNATEGTFVVEADKTASGGSFPVQLLVSNGTTNNFIGVLQNSSASYRRYLQVTTGGVTQVTLDTADSAFAFSRLGTSALVYKVNDFAFSRDGEAAQTDTSGTVPTVDRLHFGQRHDGALVLNGHIARITYYNTRLSNSIIRRLSA